MNYIHSDIMHYIFHFLCCYDMIMFCMASKSLRVESRLLVRFIRNRLRTLRTTVHMVCQDNFEHRLSFAMRWAQEIVQYKYARPQPIAVGNIVDGCDYLGAWSVCTVLDSRMVHGRQNNTYYPFLPISNTPNVEYFMERGELSEGKPFYKEYLVRFQGWPAIWEEWLTSDRIARLGTYTINPWEKRCTRTKQWVLQKQKSGEWKILLTTLHEFQTNLLPTTDVLVCCLCKTRVDGFSGMRFNL